MGADTLKDGEVVFREGPISKCARLGGFGVLDEVNMAKNEALAVLHATLDFRGSSTCPGMTGSCWTTPPASSAP